MASKPYYKNVRTGNYGILEERTFSVTPGQSNEYLSLKLVEVVGGMIELSSTEEKVLLSDLSEVSPEDVQKALLG